MASPYFSQINLPQQDFSMLKDAGQAMGAAYQQAGAAIGQLGSAYFERQGKMKQAERFAKSDMGQAYLRGQGMPQDELDKLNEDPKAAKKFIYDAQREAGGIDKLMAQVQANYAFDQLQETDRQKEILFEQERKINKFQLEELQRKDDLQDQSLLYMQHLNSKNDDGVFYRDSDDPTGGFPTDNPAAYQAVLAVNEKLGLGMHDPRILSMFSDSLAQTDTDGTQLPYRNFASEADMFKQIDALLNSPAGRKLPVKQRNALIERQKLNIDGAGGKKTARELFKTEMEASGFGAFAEAMKTNVGTMGNFRKLLDETLIEKEDGTMGIKNPVAASVALMQMARIAQGVGVLSNQDVNLIKGSQRIGASYERLIEKNLGESVDLTQDMIDQNPAWQNSINPDTGEVFKEGDPIYLGGANLSAADMKMFQSLADALDGRATEFQKKVIPDIYKNVRATYGGFTIDELNKFTDLHQYMPNGIVDLNPMSQVTTNQMDAVHNMMRDGMERNEAINFIRQNSMNDPNTDYDDDTDGKAINAMVDRVYDGLYKPRHNAHVKSYYESADYKGGGRNLPKPEIEMPDNLNSSSDFVENVGAGAITASIMKGADAAKVGSLRLGVGLKSKIAKESFPFKKQALGKIKDLSGKELKGVAKEFNVKGADKMSDKAIRQQITTRIKQEVRQEVKEKLIAMGAKKKVFSALTKVITSGTVGSLMFLIDAVQADNLPRDARLSALKNAVDKSEAGSPEREIAQEMFDRAYYTDPRNVRPEERLMSIKDRKFRHSIEQYGL